MKSAFLSRATRFDCTTPSHRAMKMKIEMGRKRRNILKRVEKNKLSFLEFLYSLLCRASVIYQALHTAGAPEI